MQTFASLLRPCVFLALSTGSLGQSVPASALEELRVEFHEMNEVLRNENVVFRVEMENKNEIFRNELENKNEALRLELTDVKTKLEDVRAVLQTQPRRTDEDFRCMSQDEDSGDIYFDGCNVHVRSGGGSTGATPNGKGNIIIGYNEPRDDDYYSLMEVPESAEGLEDTEAKKVEAGEPDVSFYYYDSSDSRGGSHNLVIGDLHEYTSFGGIVTGSRNQISNKYSAVVGGELNKATGGYSTVTGGGSNTASGGYSSISGGVSGKSSGQSSSISGGNGNTASNYYSSISGGNRNSASGLYSSISGGYYNTATGQFSSVLGGRSNDAQGDEAVVTGGLNNKAIGDRASVVGGKKNKATKRLSVVTGA